MSKNNLTNISHLSFCIVPIDKDSKSNLSNVNKIIDTLNHVLTSFDKVEKVSYTLFVDIDYNSDLYSKNVTQFDALDYDKVLDYIASLVYECNYILYGTLYIEDQDGMHWDETLLNGIDDVDI